MLHGLVLSTFPGGGLLDRAFEEAGFCVVRAPDILWGGDVRDFHVVPGRFDGLIGGPPCQIFSRLTEMNGTKAVNLIPEYLRIFEEGRFRWAVMENVVDAIPAGPNGSGWSVTKLRDWDCGGRTNRTRAIWVYGVPQIPVPPSREGQPEWSVLASQWKTRTGKSGKGGTKGMHQTMDPQKAADLQGYPGLGERIMQAQPGGVSDSSRKCLAIHMLGNGVPHAMGAYIANHVKTCLSESDQGVAS